MRKIYPFGDRWTISRDGRPRDTTRSLRPCQAAECISGRGRNKYGTWDLDFVGYTSAAPPLPSQTRGNWLMEHPVYEAAVAHWNPRSAMEFSHVLPLALLSSRCEMTLHCIGLSLCPD